MEFSTGQARCVKCGANIREAARFCVECGTPVTVVDGVPSTTLGTPVAKSNAPKGAGARPPSRRTAEYSVRPEPERFVGAVAPQREPASPPPKPRGRTQKMVPPVDTTPAAPKNFEAPPNDPQSQPPPQKLKRGKTDPELAQLFGDVEQSFEALLNDPATIPQATTESDMQSAQGLFRQIAAAYIAPVRDFMIELRIGEVSKDWIQITVPALASMASSAERMGLATLASALTDLRTTLETADEEPGTTVTGAHRDRVLEKSRTVMTELPEAFRVDEERDRREPIIVRSLLCQVTGVRKVQLDKLYRAGLTSLAMFLVARPQELAEASGLEFDLCTRIAQRFQKYKREILAGPTDAERSTELYRIEELCRELKKLNDDYEDDKKRVRARRAEVVYELNVVFARLGGVDLIEMIERLPFQRKVEEIERFLEQRRAAS